MNSNENSQPAAKTISGEDVRDKMISGLQSGRLVGVMVVTGQHNIRLTTAEGFYELPEQDYFIVALPPKPREAKIGWLPTPD
jgi:hypothetical protein